MGGRVEVCFYVLTFVTLVSLIAGRAEKAPVPAVPGWPRVEQRLGSTGI